MYTLYEGLESHIMCIGTLVMENIGLYVAQIWHELLMNSSDEDDVIKYAELMNHSPVEIRIILITESNNCLLFLP